VDIEYVADAMLDPSDPLYSDWIKVKIIFQINLESNFTDLYLFISDF
jgi:hypothetical protein